MKVLSYFIIIFHFLLHNVSADSKIENVKIHDPYLLITMPNPKMVGGYMIIENNNEFEITLVSVRSDFAKNVEIHKTVINNDQMKMIKIKDGLTIQPNSALEFKPGSFHLMVKGIVNDINLDEKYTLELNFSNIGIKKIDFFTKKIN